MTESSEKAASQEYWDRSIQLAVEIRDTIAWLNRLRIQARELGIEFDIEERTSAKAIFVTIRKTL